MKKLFPESPNCTISLVHISRYETVYLPGGHIHSGPKEGGPEEDSRTHQLSHLQGMPGYRPYEKIELKITRQTVVFTACYFVMIFAFQYDAMQ